MKEKIIDVLNEYAFNTENQAGVQLNVIESSDFPQIATEIITAMNKEKQIRKQQDKAETIGCTIIAIIVLLLILFITFVA